MKKQHIIISFIAALLALCAVSCQEELNPITTVTLHAVTQDFNNDSKVYINDHTPYWQNGDRIRINGADYPIYAATENPAPIHNVAICATGYRALFPAGILTNSDADINSSSSVAVTLPAAQVFKKVGPFQRVDVPMGAYFDSGNTLQFHNLCSVVRVYVSNATNAQLPITSISLTAEHAYLSGTGTATIMGDSTDAIVIPSANGSHSVSLCNTDNSTIKTVEPLKTVYFDVVIPEFSVRDDLTVTVFTPTGVKSITIEDAVLARVVISPQQIEILPPSARYTAVLTYMEEHAEETSDSEDFAVIEQYVKDRQKSFLDLAINRKSTDAVRYMVMRGLIDEEALREYLNKSAATGRVEITALLLDSLKDSNDNNGLSEDPFE